MASSNAFRLFIILLSAIVLIYLVTTIELSSTQYHKWVPRIAPETTNQNDANQRRFSSEDVREFKNVLQMLTLDIKNSLSDKELIGRLPENKQLNNRQTYALVEQDSNLAMLYWDEWLNFTNTHQITLESSATYCSGVTLTSPFDVRQINRYWQRFDAKPAAAKNEVIGMFLLNAYYDKRIDKIGRPVVKLITVNKQEPVASKRKWSCLLWFDNIKEPVLVDVSEYHNIWPKKWRPHIEKGTYHSQLISCPLPVELADHIPRAVSLQSASNCKLAEQKPSNVLRVIYNQRSALKEKKSFGVCIQSFRFVSYDVSVRLVEWLEMMRILGADKVYLYVLGMTESLRKVLTYYRNEGLVDWREFTLAGEQPNIGPLYNLVHYNLHMNFWPQELIELNDCLYRNLYRHDYLAIVDIDEVIMPQRAANWHELIRGIEESIDPEELKHKAFYNSRHSHVCEVYEEHQYRGRSIPPFLYMMRHRRRGIPLPYNKQNKCFIRTDLVYAVHNHFPLNCVNSSRAEPLTCDGITIDPDDSVMLHFRRNNSNPEFAYRNWQCPVREQKVLQYYDAMEDNVRTSLQRIFR